MRILRVLHFIDDLAEVVVFDVLFKTARRRWLLAALIAAACSVAGFRAWFAPAPALPTPWWPGETRPVLDAWPSELHWPFDDSELEKGNLPLFSRNQWDAVLEPANAQLDACVTAVSGDALPRFYTRVQGQFADQAPRLLALRGAHRLRIGDGDRGVRDLIAAMGLARAIGRPVVGAPGLMTALDGMRAERTALALAETAVKSRWTHHHHEAQLFVELAHRGSETVSFTQAVEAEIQFCRRLIELWGETGRWGHEGYARMFAAFELWLPREPVARRRAAKSLADSFEYQKRKELFTVASGEEPNVTCLWDEHWSKGGAAPKILGYDVPLLTDRVEFVRAFFFESDGRVLANRMLVHKLLRCRLGTQKEWNEREQLAERLRKVLLGSLPRFDIPPRCSGDVESKCAR